MHSLHIYLPFLVLTCFGWLALGSIIIDGQKAPENSMLYMVSVQHNEHHVCGGFLITEEYVVTAAHCDHPPTVFTVVIGTHNLKKTEKTVLKVIQKYKHPTYENVGMGNDIMLLKLSSKVQLGNGVQIIQLPHSEITIKENEICQVAGWGMTSTNSRPVDELRVVDVSVISREVCAEMWPGLPENVICAGGYKTTKGFCQGDSGGPLVCNGMAVGVASFNKHANCAYPDVPNVYTDVSKYLSWIDGILKG
ncbi:mast cell protease 1A-like isoform X2 [Parambassis ranga]|uniref:Mast cell protease 1A-like isoform X2 n=1 Tax=Parambassis ranga TaxID=210632 RepID=A0A6P7HT71_9TELE|nr:mast cell protease 1A-like isoform X2 [Parambassis ranga]